MSRRKVARPAAPAPAAGRGSDDLGNVRPGDVRFLPTTDPTTDQELTTND